MGSVEGQWTGSYFISLDQPRLPGLHLFLKNKSAFTAQPLANRLIKAN
jgi:hypothetical protein